MVVTKVFMLVAVVVAEEAEAEAEERDSFLRSRCCSLLYPLLLPWPMAMPMRSPLRLPLPLVDHVRALAGADIWGWLQLSALGRRPRYCGRCVDSARHDMCCVVRVRSVLVGAIESTGRGTGNGVR